MDTNPRINSKGQIIEELDVLETDKSSEKNICKYDANKNKVINEIEILTWCEIYLAAKKKGISLFHPSKK
jgi:hypothetical protein